MKGWHLIGYDLGDIRQFPELMHCDGTPPQTWFDRAVMVLPEEASTRLAAESRMDAIDKAAT